MCPDKQIISSYVDNEIPSPWNKTIQDHIASCSDCKKIFDTYSKLRCVISSKPLPDFSSSSEKVLANIQAHVSTLKPSIWKLNISIPIPLAVAAMAFIAFLIGFAFVKPQNGSMNQFASNTTDSIPTIATPVSNNMSQDAIKFLESLSGQDMQINIIVQMPDSTPLSVYGKPEIVKTTNASGGTPK